MTDALRVLLEVGPKGRRVVAGATDWPGLDRWGKTDDDALQKLTSYLPRYADVADRAGLGGAFAARARSTWSSATPAIARPTTGASPTFHRRPSARCFLRRIWTDAWSS